MSKIGCIHTTDARGNLLIAGVASVPEHADIVIMAHLDEIALIVVEESRTTGRLRVAALGGAYPWKWGEGLTPSSLPASRSPRSSPSAHHTNAPGSTAMRRLRNPLTFRDDARLFTGLTLKKQLAGTRRPPRHPRLSASSRRTLTTCRRLHRRPFLDDRATSPPCC